MKVKILILVFLIITLVGGAFVYSDMQKQKNIIEQTKNTLSNIEIKEKLKRTASSSSAYVDRADNAEKLLSYGTLTDKEQEAFLKIVYANNSLEKTTPGTDELRKQVVMTSYKTLFEVVNNNEYSATARGTAMQGLSYIYLESCSIDDWFIEAISLYDPTTYQKITASSSENHSALASEFDRYYQKQSLSLVKSYYNEINLAVSLLKYVQANPSMVTSEKEALIRQSEALYSDYKKNNNNKGFYDSNSFFSGRKLELEIRYLISLHKINPSENLKQEIQKTGYSNISEIVKDSYASAGQKLTESFIRMHLAVFIFDTYGTEKSNEVANLLKPIYQPETIPQIQGLIFWLKRNENTSAVMKSLKKYSLTDNDLKKFLLGIGWKY